MSNKVIVEKYVRGVTITRQVPDEDREVNEALYELGKVCAEIKKEDE